DTLVTDHEKSQQQVQDLADQMGIKLADRDKILAGKEHDDMMKLQKLQGTNFDRKFASAMVEDHKKGISRLEAAQATTTGKTADLIRDTLPVFRQHQKMAEQLLLDLRNEKSPS